GQQDFIINANFPENTWSHIAVTFDSNNDAHFYLNGDSLGAIAGGAAASTNGNPLLVGYRNSLEIFKGKMDEIRIWNTARTKQQIQENYRKRLIGNEIDLELMLNAEYKTNFALVDYSGEPEKVAYFYNNFQTTN